MEDHIQEGELLRAADGELSKDRAAQVSEHLAACWMCRTRLNDCEGTIHQFVKLYIHQSESRIPKIDGPRALLRARIMELEKVEKRSWREIFSLRGWGAPVYSAITALAIAVISFQFAASRKAAPRLTVADVLSKAESGEQVGLRQAKQPVTYQKVQIRVGGNTYSRSIYRDKINGRHVAKLENAAGQISDKDSVRALSPVEQAFSDAKLDWEAPLSPSRLNGWRSSLRVKEDRISSDRTTTEVATATPDGPIAEAKVTFRNADFHPVAEALRMRDNSVVEIAELDYKVLELGHLKADLFNSEPAPLFTVPAPRPEGNRDGDNGLALELEVMKGLDHANALMGEQISIDRHRDSVEVRGVLDGKQRRDEILMALGPAVKNPALRLELAVPDGTARAPRSAVHETIEGVEEFQRAPADGSLREFFAKKPVTGETTEEVVERFTDEVSHHSQSAKAHALALRQIAQRFSADELRAMTPEEHRQWRDMLKTHAGAVLNETRLMQENLEPVFRANAEDKSSLAPSLKSDADLVYAAVKLSDLTTSNDSAVWHSFAASTQASNVTLVCLPEFWESLLDAEILAQEISASTTNAESRF
jgi:hypothetical protein